MECRNDLSRLDEQRNVFLYRRHGYGLRFRKRIAAGGHELRRRHLRVPEHAQPFAEGEVRRRKKREGAGFAAAFAKVGAVMTAFLFPLLLVDIGTQGCFTFSSERRFWALWYLARPYRNHRRELGQPRFSFPAS